MPLNGAAPPPRRAVFLDRDGTLIAEVGYLGDPEKVSLLPGVPAAMRALQDAGYARIVVTNQSAIGRGLISHADYESVTARFQELLRAAACSVDAVYHCPAVPRTADRTAIDHADRKPGPGMLQRAARDHGIDLARSWMVGDMISDALAGLNAGCRSILLTDANEGANGHDHWEGPVAVDLVQAVGLIVTSDREAAECS